MCSKTFQPGSREAPSLCCSGVAIRFAFKLLNEHRLELKPARRPAWRKVRGTIAGGVALHGKARYVVLGKCDKKRSGPKATDREPSYFIVELFVQPEGLAAKSHVGCALTRIDNEF